MVIETIFKWSLTHSNLIIPIGCFWSKSPPTTDKYKQFYIAKCTLRNHKQSLCKDSISYGFIIEILGFTHSLQRTSSCNAFSMHTIMHSSQNMPDIRQTFANVWQRALTLPDILSSRAHNMETVWQGRPELPDIFAGHWPRKMSGRGSKCPAEH